MTSLLDFLQRVATFLLHVETADNTTEEQKDVATELREEVTEMIQQQPPETPDTN